MTDQYPSPGFQPPSQFGSEPSSLQPPIFQPASAASGGGSGSSPRGAKIVAIVLAVLLVVVAAGAGVLISGARSDTDDAKSELASVKQSLDSSLSGSGSVEDQIDEMVNQQDSDARDNAEMSATIDDQNSQIAELNSQLDATGDVATVQAALDQANAELAQIKADFEQGQSDLADANAALVAAQTQPAVAAFTVEPASIKPILGDFSVTTNKVACDGFADPVAACPDTIPLSGRFIEDGTQLFMEFADVAKVPIGSFDGFNYAGSTPATNEASSLCGGQVVAATMTVQIAPVRYSVDPATQAVNATAFSFSWTIASDKSAKCTGSTRTYTGTVAF